jgi:hypothetical protein
VKFAFIAKHRGVWQTKQMCEMLGVSRSGFYDWLMRPESARAQRNRLLLTQIRTSFESSDRTYGSPRVWKDLIGWGYACGENRVARLMQKAGRRRRRAAKSRSSRFAAIACSLRRPWSTGVPAVACRARYHLQHEPAGRRLGQLGDDGLPTAPNQRWVADFTSAHRRRARSSSANSSTTPRSADAEN